MTPNQQRTERSHQRGGLFGAALFSVLLLGLLLIGLGAPSAVQETTADQGPAVADGHHERASTAPHTDGSTGSSRTGVHRAAADEPVGDDVTAISSCTTITEPGQYQLTSDILDAPNATCLEIRSDNVAVDGGGHRLDGATGTETQTGVYVNGTGVEHRLRNVTVEGLQLTDWTIGVHFRETTGGVVEDLSVSRGLYGVWTVRSDGNRVQDSRVRNTTIGFAHLDADGVVLANDSATDNTWGIHFEDGSTDAVVKNTTARNNQNWDYYVHRFDEPANHTVRSLSMSSATVSFDGGRHVALRSVESPPTLTERGVSLRGAVEYGRAGSNPSFDWLSVESRASERTASSLSLWRYAWNRPDEPRSTGNWARATGPTTVSDSGTAVRVSEPALPRPASSILFGLATTTEAPEDSSPLEVSTGPATNESNGTTTVSGTVSSFGGAESVTVSVAYWPEGEPAATQWSNSTQVETGPVSASLSLEADTTYSYRLSVRTDDGRVGTGDVRTLQTPPAATDPGDQPAQNGDSPGDSTTAGEQESDSGLLDGTGVSKRLAVILGVAGLAVVTLLGVATYRIL